MTDLPKDRPTPAGHDPEGDDCTGSAPLAKKRPHMDVMPPDRQLELDRLEQVKAVQRQTQARAQAFADAGYRPPNAGQKPSQFIWRDGKSYQASTDRNRLPLPVQR
jgi:hypothetical protein